MLWNHPKSSWTAADSLVESESIIDNKRVLLHSIWSKFLPEGSWCFEDDSIWRWNSWVNHIELQKSDPLHNENNTSLISNKQRSIEGDWNIERKSLNQVR